MMADDAAWRLPFAYAVAFAAVVSLAVFRLPEPFLAQLADDELAAGAGAGWAVRLLLVGAIAQALYAGAGLRVDQVAAVTEATGAPTLVVSRLARSAALVVCLTLVFGIAMLALTGQRGTFWLFVLLAVLQGAWYYRQVGLVHSWVRRQATDRAAER